MAQREARILCIGSGPIELNLRCALLKEQGWAVLSAGNGHEGVLLFGKELVDAVILDLDGDGSESALIAGELKRQRPQVPIVMVTKPEEFLLNGAIDLASAVIKKADEATAIVATLTQILGKTGPRVRIHPA